MRVPRLNRIGERTICRVMLGAGVILGTAIRQAAAAVQPPTLADADKRWKQHSYARALTEYEGLQKAGRIPAARRDEIAYRVAVLPGKTEQWDRGLRDGLGFVQAHRGTIWEARGLYWLGRLYLSVPHQGWRVGGRTFRGANVPKSEGDDKPVSIDVTVRDQRNALDALEAAHILYAQQTAGASHQAAKPELAEQAQLDFDLIHVLQQDPNFPAWAQQMRWLPPNDPSWSVNAGLPYDPAWPQPKKILFLHEYLIHTDFAPQGVARRTAALALWSEALWLRRYLALMRGWTLKYENGKPIQVPFPYRDMRPAASLEQLAETYPADADLCDQAQIVMAGWQAQDGDLTGSVRAYRQFLARRAGSKWAGDARARIAALLDPSVSVGSLVAARPGHAPRLEVSYRNTKKVHFDAYRIDLPTLLTRRHDTGDNENWGDLSGLIGSQDTSVSVDRTLINRYRRNTKRRRATLSLFERLSRVGARRVTSWDMQTTNHGDLRSRSQNITAPITAAGAYVVVASVPGQRYGLLVPISDLVLVQKKERGSSLFYVADAETGRPQPVVKVVAKLLWHKSRESETSKQPLNIYGARITNALTGRDGVVTVPVVHEKDADNEQLGAIAVKGGRFALIGPEYINTSPLTVDPEQIKGYMTTDRAVYRPRQIVQFRQLLMRRGPGQNGRQGEMRPLANRMARVVVSDPQGNLVFKQRTLCSAWGSVSGRFMLPDRAPLGEYGIEVTLPKQGTGNAVQGTDDADTSVSNAGSQFRVEEYKKPEYEVTVTPTSERVRLGQTTRAKIHAAYYFGGPVAGANVTYRVYRNVYAASYRFPEPYDYLYYTDDKRGGYDTNYRSGEVVAQGRARLDAKGDAFVTFETRAGGQRWNNSDLSYTVEADVQDQSRRVISGTGAVKATRHDVAVFLRFPHGYATQNDRVDVEVKTLNPSDQPVSVGGMARVYRQPNQPDTTRAEVPAVGIRHGETLVWSQPLHTDVQGYAQIAWKANTAGYFRIAFETQDADAATTAASPGPNAANNKVNKTANSTINNKDSGKTNVGETLVGGETLVWVDGPELRSRRFLFQGVTLAVQNPYYQEGQTANALLVTPEPGCTVLLTREIGGRILDRRVVLVPGRSLQIPVSVTGRDVPNVFLSALMIRHGEMFEAAQELFVPPVRQTARVTVTPDKAKYAPGEKARLQITARDYLGRPLRTELSVGVSDAALAYIQKDYAPDIRAYFYGDRRQQNIENAGSSQTNFSPLSETIGPVTIYPRHTLTMPGGMGQIPAALLSDNYFGMQREDGLIADSGSNRIVDQGGNVYLDASGVYHAQTPTGTIRAAGRVSFYNGNATQYMWSADVRSINGSTDYAKSSAAGEATAAASPASEVNRPFQIQNESNFSSRIAPRPSMRSKQVFAPDDLASATIRSEFRDTAFWTPNVVTDAQGRASVTVTWPDNLTQWRANVIGSTQAAQVGVGEARVTTKKDLLVQLESPRFVVERDVVTLSAIVHNDTARAQRVRVRLDLDNADVVAEDLAVGLAAPSVRLAAYRKEEKKRLKGQEGTGGQNASNAVQGGGRVRVRTSETWVMIAAGGQRRVDWLARPQHEGVMYARMTAQSPTDADAAQTTIPVLVHGVERTNVQSGVLKTALAANVTITLPAQRKPGSSQLVVTLNPSLAGVMLDALPYLADYPYGCVEQTLSRFVPSVLVARSLKASGYDLADLERAAHLHGNIRTATIKGMQTPPVANSAYTYPNAQSGQSGLSHQEVDGIGERWHNPIFSQSKLNKMVRDGLARLKDMQHPDGGWGWWKDDTSDVYMTTNVLYGLLRAKGAGVVVDADEMANGLKYLQSRYLAETDLQQMAYQARVLALAPTERNPIRNRVAKRLYVQRDKLSAYGKALLALALHDLGQNGQARVVLENLENTVHLDALNGTAYWDDINTQWWRWYNNKIETNATVLEAYTAIAPNAALPAQLVKWLVNNRRGTSWHDTRDTALTVGALAAWARVHKELSPDYTLTVDLGGRIRRVYYITHQNALWNDNTFVVPDALLQTGAQTLSITREGTGTCYYTATTRTFSQEEPITATGNEIHVTRRYFRLIANTATGTEEQRQDKEAANKEAGNMSASGRPEQDTEGKITSEAVSSLSSVSNPFLTGQYEMLEQGGEQVNGEDTTQGPRYKRVELKPGEMLDSGDLLEVELGLEAQNDYDYVLFEDMKPAGCEPVELRSGGHQGQGVYSNMELRDEKVAFFLTSLGQGRRVLSYRLRAEIPGAFHVLPTNGYAMYAPDVRTLSDEARISIRDEEPAETARTSDDR